MTDTTKAVTDWNVRDFHAYLKSEHIRIFGVEYAPSVSYGREQGLIGDLIGTKGKNAKPRRFSNEMVKAFIDEVMPTWKPTQRMPGTNFGLMWQYRSNVWQRLQLEARSAQGRTDVDEDNGEWF